MAPERLQIGFLNPPHADWCLVNLATWFGVKSHYQRQGRFRDRVHWISPPYQFDRYSSLAEVAEQFVHCDIVLVSSYIWNYDICDGVAELLKREFPEKLLVLGGPHIGTNDPEFLAARSFYDLICRPTKPGEIFVESLIDQYFENHGQIEPSKVAWELRSAVEVPFPIPAYSIYSEHLDFLREIRRYAQERDLEPFVVIETTRGCPYSCVYCEWGGGTDSRILFRPIEVVKQEIRALSEAGFNSAYLTDANFGVFEQRDIEIFRYAFENHFALTDISTVKSKDLARRKRIVDAWFKVVGKKEERRFQEPQTRGAGLLTERNTRFVSSLPTVSIQSISDRAMEIAQRVDLSFSDKIKLSEHIRQRCEIEGFPVPALELIQAMPGSTLDDFYKEMEVIWNFKAWNSFRHDYMFLPDTQLSRPEYLKKHSIELVEVYTDLVDEAGVDNIQSLYQGKKNFFYTIASCFSFTRDEMKEIFIMNLAGNFLLKNIYPFFEHQIPASVFGKYCYRALQGTSEFDSLLAEVSDIFDPKTPPRSIKKLGGMTRMAFMEGLVDRNRALIFNEVYKWVNQHELRSKKEA